MWTYGCVGYGTVGVARPAVDVSHTQRGAMSASVLEKTPSPSGSKSLTEGKQGAGVLIALWVFVILPFVALVAAVPVAWGWGLTWLDVAMTVVLYVITGMGIGTGFHRYLTHGSFKATRPLRIA